jgi:hypothetical protein
MPTKDPIKKAEANRERQKRYRERHQTGVIQSQNNENITPKAEKITQGVTSPVIQSDYDKLPPSLKYGVANETRRRQILKMPLELEERQEMAVRRFRGY